MPSFTLLASTLVASVAVAAPLSARQSDPFTGSGIINVVDGTTTVGCLTTAMQFTTDTSKCGTFVGTSTTSCEFDQCSTSHQLQTTAGPCGSIFHSGSQYEEGGNGVLTCGSSAVGSDKDEFSFTGGVNNQIGLILLEDSNGSAGFNTIGGAAASATPQDLQDDLGLGAEVGTSYVLTWTAS